MKLTVDAELCAGHGRCYDIAPELVESDDDGYAVIVVTGDLDPTQHAAASTAVRNCPERALSLTP